MFRLGIPVSMNKIDHGDLIYYGGFVFRIPVEYTHIETDKSGDVFAFNKTHKLKLGVFKKSNTANSKLEILR